VDFTVIWTDRALGEFADAVRFIAADDPLAAARFRDAVLRTTEGLGPLPYLGSRYEPSRDRRVREILCPPYRIFYRAIDSREIVEVLTIWHSARREPKI
jgi:plasmid stabilization system protein ParE